MSRRGFLAIGGLSAIGLFTLTSCRSVSGSEPAAAASFIRATDPEVDAAERLRRTSGATVSRRLSAGAGTADLGAGMQARTWGFSEGAALAAIGPTIAVSVGDRLVVGVENDLMEETSVHWHGLRIRNDMDGSPPDTQDAIAPGALFTYDFTVPDPGTYWYHSHSGLQADRAMLGALIVADPNDASGADVDLVLLIDDWTDGVSAEPDDLLRALGGSGAHAHGGASSASADVSATAIDMVSQGMGHSDVLGGPAQHIKYQLHLLNGRGPDDPDRLTVPDGSRVRLRVINAAAETPYRVALGGHRVTVIATDGFETEPFETSCVLIAPAQRIDLLVDLQSGAWPFVAQVEGRDGGALAVIATGDTAADAPVGRAAMQIAELQINPTTDADLRPHARAALADRAPDQHWRLELLEAEDRYQWGIGGPDVAALQPRIGERIRISMTNLTRMWHPMHLHGHTFASITHGGVRRDTTVVLPGQTVDIEFDADNPGHWMLHCHNAYHFAAGMTVPVRYIR